MLSLLLLAFENVIDTSNEKQKNKKQKKGVDAVNKWRRWWWWWWYVTHAASLAARLPPRGQSRRESQRVFAADYRHQRRLRSGTRSRRRPPVSGKGINRFFVSLLSLYLSQVCFLYFSIVISIFCILDFHLISSRHALEPNEKSGPLRPIIMIINCF